MAQIAVNLIVNARDAMPKGGKLKVKTFAASPDAARLEITDTGIGMNEEERKRIFEPFFTTKEPGQGTGLGMAQVHGIVMSHGGHISVSSAPGHGTRVVVDLPVVDAPSIRPEASSPSAVVGDGASVLLVEDNKLVRESCAMRLEERGYSVLQAANAHEALVQARAHPARVVLLDVDLPGVDGVEAATQLRECLGPVPVVYITGNPDNPALKRAHAADPVLPKPVNFEHLLNLVAQCCEAAHSAG